MPNSTIILPSQTIRIRTPDGTLYAIISENPDGSVARFDFTIGKCGTALNAWVVALAAVMTLAVEKGITIEELMFVLSNITSDRTSRSIESTCRSGPEGIWMALVRYKHSSDLIMTEDEPQSRGASVGPGTRVRNR